MVAPPSVSWRFFKAPAKCPYLNSYGSIRRGGGKIATGHGPKGCVENGPAAFPRLRDRSQIESDMLPPRASQAAHFERNGVIIIWETVH